MKCPERPSDAFDISPIMKNWPYQSGQVNVRLIQGRNNRPKLQMRMDLGLLQMELNGRPDGKRPHRRGTELEYQLERLQKYIFKQGSEIGFVANTDHCNALREESAMFYHRYLAAFVMELYEIVLRDTGHNLAILDFCNRFGKSEFDRNILEQYRPYIIMMNTRAKALQTAKGGFLQTALGYIRGGLQQISDLIHPEMRKDYMRNSSEVAALRELARQLKHQAGKNPNPRTVLMQQLGDALKAERYEEAAQIRDQLREASPLGPDKQGTDKISATGTKIKRTKTGN